MAERRSKARKKKAEQSENEEEEVKPQKEEYAIAKYLRQKLPPKKTSLLGHKVDYFIASMAIDCLLESPWATKSSKSEVYFSSRESVVKFMDKMLRHKFYHRAKKIIITKKKKDSEESETVKEKESKKPKVSKEESETVKEKESKKTKATKEESEEKPESKEKSEDKKGDSTKTEDKKADDKEGDGSDKKKEKKKIKLDMHLEQLYIDGNEVYVWIYDPIPMRTWIFGMLMVVGAVLVCLFPLWPQIIRHYIYYLSVAAAFFLVFIIGLAIIRLIVFVLIWLITFGKHHLWILPNLTEDVGFFESFWPLYKYEYKGATSTEEESKKDDKTKDSEKEEKEKETVEKSDSSSDQEKKADEDQSETEERDSEECDKASSKADNGFELLDAEEMAGDPYHKKNE